MRSETPRDETTLQIAGALAAFVGVYLIGGAALFLVHLVIGLSDAAASLGFWALTVGGALVAIVVTMRTRRSQLPPG